MCKFVYTTVYSLISLTSKSLLEPQFTMSMDSVIVCMYVINPARMRSEGYSTWFVCLSVSTLILALQAMRRPMSDTNYPSLKD